MSLHISGAHGEFRLTIGGHDLSDLKISMAGPIVETIAPGPNPMRLCWLPIYFQGELDDPEGLVRVVREGEANQVGLPEG